MDDGDETRGDRTVDERPQSARSRESHPSKPRITADRYRIGERIGRGGMGEVIAAHDEQIGREVAIKRIRTDEPSERMIKRFLREARIQGRLEHPAIVPVHELGRDTDGMPFFAMKKLVGNPLSKIVDNPDRDRVKVGRQRLLRAFVDVCLAIEFAHVAGIIHRDIKPDNIVLGDFGEVYVLDWGVAKVVGEDDDFEDIKSDDLQTRAGVAIGTPGYMSPEQAMGETTIDARSDVYALGIVLGNILDADPEPPPELIALREHATAEKPEARIQTARELGDAVQRFLDGDRDLAMRRKLALEHLDVARAAMPERDGFDGRRKAMMQAGRALALDPELVEAGQLITQLIVEPPKDVPPEVEAELARDATSYTRALGRASMVACICYVALLPGLIAMASLAYTLALTGAIAGAFTFMWLATRSDRQTYVWTVQAFHVVVIFILARMYTPLLVNVGFGVLLCWALVANPVMRSRTVSFVSFAVVFCAVLAPLAAEQFGWVSPTLVAEPGGGIALRGLAMNDSRLMIRLLGPGFALVMIGVAAVIGHYTRTTAQQLRTKFYVQAWQIRHLMPEQRRR
jgi:eukaryotic-like serine/threonine-protein kinase